MLPPPELLQVQLTIDGAPVPLEAAELHLSVDATDLREGRWIEAAHPDFQMLLSLRFGATGSGLIVRIPPQQLGLPITPDDDPPEFALVVQQSTAPRSQHLRGLTGRAEVTPRGLHATLQGTFADGRALTLVFTGIPGAIQATVVEAQGSAAAAAWLAQLRSALRLTEAGETTEVDRGDEGDKTLLQRWSPQAWVDFEAAERVGAQKREEVEAPAAAQAELRRGPAPEPTTERPLVAGHRAYQVGRGELQLNLHNRDGATHLALHLELVVDEHSGEDGALAPSFYAPLGPLPWSLPVGPQGSTVVPGHGATESWYGNDAPELFTTHFNFRLRGDRAEVDWRATYDDWETRREEVLQFRGWVDFHGLQLESPGDLEVLLADGLDQKSRDGLHLGPIEFTPDGGRRARAKLL
ncbi:MAG: hypothetical protein IPG45_13265 [Deltaproteobacteria bacterium]|nr:hypothetical protein [Deltaproteobacteria bacterium]